MIRGEPSTDDGEGRKRGRDTVSTLAFMSSKARLDERRDVFADAKLDDASSLKLASFVKRFRKASQGGSSSAAEPAERIACPAFASDVERILQISDDHVEQLMLPESASELTRAAFRVAGTGMNLAIVSAAPCEEQRMTVRALAESAAALGISCLVLHATRASFLTSAIRESEGVRQHVISYVLGLGGGADSYPPEMAARIIRSRFPRELAPLFHTDQRPMIIVEDVFSLSRAALARVEALVSALLAGASSSKKKSWSPVAAGWGGAQVIVSGCPIRSAAPLQLRKTDDLDFLPCTIEWERWFPVMIEVPPPPGPGGEGCVAASLLLLSEDPESSKAREHRARVAGGLSIRPVAEPSYLSGFPGVTIVAFQGLADAKMRKQMENLRSRGFDVFAPGTRMTLKIKDADRGWTLIPSPISDPAGYEAEAARVGFRTRPVPDFLRKSREESSASSVVRPDHFEVHEHVRQVIKYNVPQASEGAVNEFAEGVAVAFTHPPERRGQVGVVESVSLTDRRVVVRIFGEDGEEKELVSVQEEESFEFENVVMKRIFCLSVCCCMPIIPITYVPLEFAAHLDLRGLRRKMDISVDPFLMEKAPMSPLVVLLSEGRVAFHKNPGESVFEFKDDLATAARYMALCNKTSGDPEFSRQQQGRIRFRSSSKTRIEFLKRE